MVKSGQILKDPSGEIMNCGQAAHFLVMHPQEKENGKESFSVVDLPLDDTEICGAITTHPVDKLERLKYVSTVTKLIWEC